MRVDTALKDDWRLWMKKITKKRYLKKQFVMPKPDRPYGHSGKQIQSVLDELKIDAHDFWVAFGVNTVAVDNDGITNYYTCDIERTLFKVTDGNMGINHAWD